MAARETTRVTVVYSAAPREVFEQVLEVPAGSTVLQALLASRLAQSFPSLELPGAGIGIWGRKAGASEVVREDDRIEVYRPLVVDPKVARRERFSRQGARAAGLFAKRKPGAKPGY